MLEIIGYLARKGASGKKNFLGIKKEGMNVVVLYSTDYTCRMCRLKERRQTSSVAVARTTGLCVCARARAVTGAAGSWRRSVKYI